ncbi:MAG: HEPN domain-containing protein [Prevotella sp.]|nr:HEPN domain-containing protein [Prevotella sp.]
MSLNHEERTDVVTYRLEKAARTFEQVKFNLPSHYWELIANRMYYAVYYAVSALLIANGYTTKTHESVIRSFGLHFVKTGIFPTEYGKLINKLFTLRLTGDYNDHYDLEEEDVIPYLDSTEKLIADVSEKARQDLNTNTF